MRITDIIVELDDFTQLGKGYQAGYDAVDRVLNPNRWFDDSKSKSDEINTLDLKKAVNLSISGKTIYLKDQQVLKQVYNKIKAGEFETRQDPAVLLPALKAAADLKPLTPQQQQTLSAFVKEL